MNTGSQAITALLLVLASAAPLTSLAQTPAPAPAAPATAPVPVETCQSKREAIQRDITHAKDQGQAQRLRGLEKALAEVNAHCTDAKLQSDRLRRIQQQEQAVAERERELKQAERDGKPEKIERRKEKLADEQEKLRRLKAAAGL